MMDGEVLVAVIDPTSFKMMENDNYLAGREVRPEQWAFDQALEKALGEKPLADSYASYQGLLAHSPHWGMHFGINLRSIEKWETAVARFGEIEKHAPALSGRVRLMKVFRPGDPDAPSTIHQAFIWTDIIASGSLALGQRIELATDVA
jgi:hypothetical protein